MALSIYKKKRDFKKTPEPKAFLGRKGKRLMFVVQKHRASHLHFDFRLEHRGTLKSWAVPKGPPLRPNNRRLAVMVEDHPLAYGKFHGTIPKGNYGAGTVEIWDRGSYIPIKSMDAGLRGGHITIMLQGKKLHGEYTLIRMQGPKNWLMIKAHAKK